MSKITFTIITVSYNSEKYISETIQSVLSQSYNNFEYLILDDNSVDGTWDIINSFKDERIRAIRNENNLGEYSNRNKAVQLATGDYFIFIDGDDIMYFNALETFAYYLSHFPGVKMICTREWDAKILYPYLADPKTIYLFEFMGNTILGGNFTKILFKKEVVEEIEYFPLHITTGDTYAQLKIAMYHNVLLINDGLTWWRQRKGNATDKFFKDERHVAETTNYRIHFLNHKDCPLTENEKEIARTNLYGNYMRILLRLIFKFRFKVIGYLTERIKIPSGYYKSIFISSNRQFFENFDGDNPLHTGFKTINNNPSINPLLTQKPVSKI